MNRGEDRKQVMASLLALTRAVPQLRPYPLIREWTLPEARRWVALMREDTPSLTAARRAAALLDLSRRYLAREDMTGEARRHFELISARDRVRMPGLWAAILLETEPAALRAALPTILKATRKGTQVSRHLAGSWLRDRRIPDDLRPLLRTWVAGLNEWELEPPVRLAFAVMDLTDAVHGGRTAEAAAHLRRMTHWARYSHYGDQHAALIREASRFKVLRPECLAFVDVILEGVRHPTTRRRLLRLRARLIARSR